MSDLIDSYATEHVEILNKLIKYLTEILLNMNYVSHESDCFAEIVLLLYHKNIDNRVIRNVLQMFFGTILSDASGYMTKSHYYRAA